MKKILFYFLCLLCTQPVWATSIVIYITPQYILIGTDSKRQLLNAGAQVVGEQNVCKVRTAGSYGYAFAGYTSASATSFSADAIVAKHLSECTDYATAISRIKQDLKKALQRQLRYQQAQEQAAFAAIQSSKEPLLEVVILSMQNGKPQVHIIGFEKTSDHQVKVGSYEMQCNDNCPQQGQLYFMGSYNKMEQYASRQKTIGEPAQFVERLIMEQAKATPSSVSTPVHMARFSASGMEWLK